MKKCRLLSTIIILFIAYSKLSNAQVWDNELNHGIELYKSKNYCNASIILDSIIPKIRETLGSRDTSLLDNLLNITGYCYHECGKYLEAEALYLETLKIQKEILGIKHPKIIITMNNLASLYQDMGRFLQAEQLMTDVIRIDQEDFENNKANYGLHVNNLAMLYQQMGYYKKAETLMKESIQIAKDFLGQKDPDYGVSLENLASLYKDMGQYEKAEPLIIEAMRIMKDTFGINHPSYSNCLRELGSLHQDMGKYAKAEVLFLMAKMIDEGSLGRRHLDFIQDINNLGTLYVLMGSYEKAEYLLTESLLSTKEILGQSNPGYIKSLNNLAQLYKETGKYYLAETLMKRAIEIEKDNHLQNNTLYGSMLNNLAEIYREIGKLDKVEPLLLEAIRITEVTLGNNQPEYGRCLNNLAEFHIVMGRYKQAETLLLETKRIFKEQLIGTHPYYGTALNNLGFLYNKMGEYEKAEPLMKEALQITKVALGKDHPSYSACLTNLATLYVDMGRFKQAEPLLIEAMKINKEALGSNHSSSILCLNNLAWLYQKTGRFEQAETLMKEALQVQRLVLGPNHPNLARYLNNLGQMYFAMGQYELAEKSMLEALQIDKGEFGNNHPCYGIDLNNLAWLYKVIGKFDKAENLMVQTNSIFKEQLGTNNQNYSTSIHNLILLYHDLGRNKKVESLMTEDYDIIKYKIRQNIGFLSVKETEEFFKTFLYHLEVYQSLNFKLINGNNSLGILAFNIDLTSKGILLNSAIKVKTRILKSEETSLINDFNNLLLLKKQIDKLYLLDSKQQFEDPKDLEQRSNDLEKELSLKSQDYRKIKEDQSMDWNDIQKKLKPDETAIEITSFKYYEKRWTDSTLYCALILRKDYTYPKMVYLFEERQLNPLLPSSSANEERINTVYGLQSEDSKARAMYELIWKPLEPYLQGVTTVDFAVSGQLNKVAFHALLDTGGNLLLNKYNLVQLSSTREVAMPKAEKLLETMAVFGGIDYSTDTASMLAMAREVNTDNLARSVYRSDSTNRSFNLQYLPGTMEEAQEVEKECEVNGMDVKLYSGKQATEEQFKLLGEKKSPSIIHIATHGFYFPEEKQKDKEDRMRFMQPGQENQFVYSPDPLIRSGLALAGANHAWKGERIPEGVEDGILTAREVSQFNLLNTELVVLSACQTGLGDVKGSEGVYGLQRAFKMAGARYLMMSLWKVPDETTKEFMVDFYGHLNKGMTIRESYRNTQLEMSKKYSDDPFKWAAFILVE
jgi:tetratricopeptide (TPR) repeat protein